MWSYLFFIVFVQITTALILPNGIPIRTPVTAANANSLPIGVPAISNTPNSWPANNQMLANLAVTRNNFGYPNSGLSGGNIQARGPNIADALRFQPGSRPKTLNLNIGDPFGPNNVQRDNPIGLNVVAGDLRINGEVSVTGRLPFQGAVAINGNVPSSGAGSVRYDCGGPNGRIL